MNIALLKQLSEAPGVPGREERVREIIQKNCRGLFDTVTVDPLGSVLWTREITGQMPATGSALLAPSSIHIDEIGRTIVIGQTNEPFLDHAGPPQPNIGQGIDTFVTWISSDGSAIEDSTYLGGSRNEYGSAIAVDSNTGNAVVTGRTFSLNFPIANPFQ